MEWTFTPEDVVKGESGYGLEDFRADLLSEVLLNLPELDSSGQRRLYDLIYDLHYWLATGRSFDEFIENQDLPAHVVTFLASVEAHSGGNVEMLGAILQREIMDSMASGANLDQALARTAALHAMAVASHPEPQVH